jgi:hypothetical protein
VERVPSNPFRDLVQGGAQPGGPPSVRIVTSEADDDTTWHSAAIAFLAAEGLVRAWWPRRSAAERERVAVHLAQAYDWQMGLLFQAIRSRPPLPPLPWRVLGALRPAAWPMGADGLPVAPDSPVRLVTRERTLEAEIAARRAGAAAAPELLAELGEVRRALGDARRQVIVKGRRLLPPVTLGAVALATAISRVLPDRRFGAGGLGKGGIYRQDVLERTHEIIFALFGTRVPLVRLKSAIQKSAQSRA